MTLLVVLNTQSPSYFIMPEAEAGFQGPDRAHMRLVNPRSKITIEEAPKAVYRCADCRAAAIAIELYATLGQRETLDSEDGPIAYLVCWNP